MECQTGVTILIFIFSLLIFKGNALETNMLIVEEKTFL
jgi:hypothetical protein